jgi:hypothetical protein
MKKKPKPWQLTADETARVKRMPRDQLEREYIAQAEQINRFLRVMKKLGQSISELQALGT